MQPFAIQMLSIWRFGILFEAPRSQNRILTAMKRIILTLTLLGFFAISAFSGAPTKPNEPCDKPTIKSVQSEEKLVLCLSGIKTDGLLLKVFSSNGQLIENVKLEGEKESYEMDKPEKGIYWVSMTKDKTAKFERVMVK